MFYNNDHIPFYNWAYNPQYINQQAYLDFQAQIRAYEQQQSYAVTKTVNKFKEYLDAAQNVDGKHREELFFAILAVVADKMNWSR